MSTGVRSSDSDSTDVGQVVGFKATILIALEICPNKFTKEQFYSIYSKIHLQLSHSGFIQFKLPKLPVFKQMIRKLMKKGLVDETYHDLNYTLKLTPKGKATSSIIIDNLREQSSFDRLANIYRFYTQSTAS